jgi:hypothetical protein
LILVDADVMAAYWRLALWVSGGVGHIPKMSDNEVGTNQASPSSQQ